MNKLNYCLTYSYSTMWIRENGSENNEKREKHFPENVIELPTGNQVEKYSK